MIDTNAINQASQDFAVVKQQVQVNWTAIAIAATFAGRELGRFNAWCVGVAEFVIKHGGAAMIIKKLIWNPQTVADDRQRAGLNEGKPN